MNEKQIAAEKSIEFIENGMTIGLGTGSTVFFLIQKLAALLRQGLTLRCISTSRQTSQLAEGLGITITDINSVDHIDLTIDGADEVDRQLNGIKGGGGALLFEKIVANSSDKVIWIVDSSKVVERLGKFPVPVEVIPFGSAILLKKFTESGFNPVLRKKGGEICITDSGNEIIDLHMHRIGDSSKLEKEIKILTGVVEVGLFNNTADILIIGKGNSAEILQKQQK